MSKLDKIIFLADYIEPGRKFQGVEDVREIAEVDLDKAILLAFNNTFKYCLKKDRLIHPQSVEARNYILNCINNTMK